MTSIYTVCPLNMIIGNNNLIRGMIHVNLILINHNIILIPKQRCNLLQRNPLRLGRSPIQ